MNGIALNDNILSVKLNNFCLTILQALSESSLLKNLFDINLDNKESNLSLNSIKCLLRSAHLNKFFNINLLLKIIPHNIDNQLLEILVIIII